MNIPFSNCKQFHPPSICKVEVLPLEADNFSSGTKFCDGQRTFSIVFYIGKEDEF